MPPSRRLAQALKEAAAREEQAKLEAEAEARRIERRAAQNTRTSYSSQL